MFKKLNTKTLLVVFGVLLAVVVISHLFKSTRGDRNFESKLFSIDTAKVSSITIVPKGSTDEVSLIKSGNTWSLQTKGKTYKAEQSIPKGMLGELHGLKVEQIVGTEKSEWNKFELNDTSAVWVRVHEGNKRTADFRVGKFSFRQPSTMITYIRLANDEKVYAVNGFLAMTFGRNPDEFKAKPQVDGK